MSHSSPKRIKIESDEASGGSGRQPTWTGPEAIWWVAINRWYPNMHQDTYFIPPLFFRRTPHSVATVAGEVVQVRENPSTRIFRRQQARNPLPLSRQQARSPLLSSSQPARNSSSSQPARNPLPPSSQQAANPPAQSTSQSVRNPTQQASDLQLLPSQQITKPSDPPQAGDLQLPPSQQKPPADPPPPPKLYVPNRPDLYPRHVQESDIIDDVAQERCLQSLSQIPSQAMVVVSQLKLRKYLDNLTRPVDSALASLPLPGTLHSSIVSTETDVLIIHRSHGLIVGEVKSVGAYQHFSQLPLAQQNQTIVNKLNQAVTQLRKQDTALRHFISDLPPIRITLTLFLPNIRYAQLSAALDTNPVLTQDLCQTLGTNDVSQAVARCLCQDLLGQPGQWWGDLVGQGLDPMMTRELYERLLCRFCGPATSVEIPVSCPPRVVVRTLGQAVAETGLRFSTLVLTPHQLDILNRTPQYLYQQGAPGTGKTVVLFLGALKAAQQGKTVVIVHKPDNVAVATLLREQLVATLGTAAGDSILLHPCDFYNSDLDVNNDVSTLKKKLTSTAHIIIDEAPMIVHGSFIRWVEAVHTTWPQAHLWMAGSWIRDNTTDESECLPPWVECCTLREPLRSPPHVTAHVAEDSHIDDYFIPRYVAPAHPVTTDGPRVRELHHRGQHGHTGGDSDCLKCTQCADDVTSVLRELHVGQPGEPLQHRDVFILTGPFCPDAHAGDVFVQRLQQSYPQTRVVQTPISEGDARQLALAADDVIVVTNCGAVQGLERRVVIVIGAGIGRPLGGYEAPSRSTSFLCIID